ncbi:hypothetical protein NQ318_018183 [Aromia moschata]|uniref:Saposin A-type domain-containing protein n=1 Tax=Aromia moschata TaxID=1265417 RepID=A0AAV8ZE72_9CUCU|nr:hypothetical protein NQ318_018183 [Aromia moschata]
MDTVSGDVTALPSPDSRWAAWAAARNALSSTNVLSCQIIVQKYGKLAFYLINSLTPHEICRRVLLCTDLRTEILVGTFHRDPCSYGPIYWCSTEEYADKCEATTYCQTKVWRARRPQRAVQVVVGSNHCTWGPGYWCQSETTADECNARKHCETKVWGASRPKRSAQVERKIPLVGADHCTRGPGYWCQSEAKADECGQGAREHCETKVWRASRPKRSPQVETRRPLVGANHCTRGPGYWCLSEATADECGQGARKHCETKVWGASRPKRSAQVERKIPLVGADHCTRGPGYWCQSEAKADECGQGAREHCETKVWRASRPKRSPQVETRRPLVGANHCTRGPGYWLESTAKPESGEQIGQREALKWRGRDHYLERIIVLEAQDTGVKVRQQLMNAEMGYLKTCNN